MAGLGMMSGGSDLGFWILDLRFFMRKCHYVFDEKAGKVLIPGCWQVVISGDEKDCICRDRTEKPSHFENVRYNQEVSQLKEYASELEKEVFRLNRILKKVKGFR